MVNIGEFIEQNVSSVENFSISVKKQVPNGCLLTFKSAGKQFETIIQSKPESETTTGFVLATIASTDLESKHLEDVKRMRLQYVDENSMTVLVKEDKGRIIFFNQLVIILDNQAIAGIDLGHQNLVKEFSDGIKDVFGELISDWEACWVIVEQIQHKWLRAPKSGAQFFMDWGWDSKLTVSVPQLDTLFHFGH